MDSILVFPALPNSANKRAFSLSPSYTFKDHCHVKKKVLNKSEMNWAQSSNVVKNLLFAFIGF